MDGKLIGFKVDGEYTPCEVTCSLKVSNDQLEASGSHNGNWKYTIEGYKSWVASVNARLMLNASPAGFAKIFKKNLLKNQTYEIIISLKIDDTNTDFFIKGIARLKDLDFTAGVSNKAEYTLDFIGQGAFEEVNIQEFYTIINAMPAYADKPLIINTSNWN